MRLKRFLMALLALGAVVAIALVAYRLETVRGSPLCQICGRDIPAQTAYRMETTSGTINACCPACAMHYMLHNPDDVRQAWASDFSTGRLIDAKSAYYDEGGDVQYCTASHPPVERGTEGISERVYDRCLPTLVAFASRHDAEAYRQAHGGRILTYDETLASLRGK